MRIWSCTKQQLNVNKDIQITFNIGWIKSGNCCYWITLRCVAYGHWWCNVELSLPHTSLKPHWNFTVLDLLHILFCSTDILCSHPKPRSWCILLHSSSSSYTWTFVIVYSKAKLEINCKQLASDIRDTFTHVDLSVGVV